MNLRDYQLQMLHDIWAHWRAGSKRVLAVAPTGSGKTVIKGALMHGVSVPSLAIAHRQELVSQISVALAEFGVRHRIFAPNPVVRFCIHRHVQRTGRSWVDHAADTAVAGIQTMNSRSDQYASFLRHVGVWDLDEGHHAVPDNQWGKGIASLPAEAFGVAFTATPVRCDRKALAASQGGLFDSMVVGPSTRDLMNRGYLSDYKVYGPPPSIRTEVIRISPSTGEYVRADMVEEAHQSRIVGDVVEHYQRLAPGKRGITFCVDLQLAGETSLAFNNAGVPAMVVTGKTDDNTRAEALDRLASGTLKQIVNVDLFGEGMDCPAIEVVSMARPTQSLGLYLQQFGRALRPSDGKDHAICIDHVGNVQRHGFPDMARHWTLEQPERRRRSSTDPEEHLPVRTCASCLMYYEAHRKACPHCGHAPTPESRGVPQHVDGDLIEYDDALKAQLMGEIDRIDGPPLIPRDLSDTAAAGLRNVWLRRQETQQELRDCIAAWAGVWKHGNGEDDSQIYRRFYLTFGTDIATAQTLTTKDATKLTEAIRGTLT